MAGTSGVVSEYPVTRNLSFGFEYQHVSLDTERYRGGMDSSRDMSADIDIIRARLTYRFGEDAHSPMK